MNPPEGSFVTVRRVTRGGSRSWRGIVLSSGTMTCGDAPMGRLAIREDNGTVQHFAIDPLMSTTVEIVRPAGAEEGS